MSHEKTGVPGVRHNAAKQRFEAELEGRLSVAEYKRRGDEITFTHTQVPLELRGRGIAEELVRIALRYASDEKLRVVPACGYVAAFIERHPEFKPLLAE